MSATTSCRNREREERERTEVHVGDKVPRPRRRHLDSRKSLCDPTRRLARALADDGREVDTVRSSLGRGGLNGDLESGQARR